LRDRAPERAVEHLQDEAIRPISLARHGRPFRDRGLTP
jgi:hypothetical protein